MLEKSKIKCFLCNNDERVLADSSLTFCPICGFYKIDPKVAALFMINKISDELRQKIRYKVKKNNIDQDKKYPELREYLFLTEERLEDIDAGLSIPTLLEKVDLLLDYISQKTTFISEKVLINPNTHFPLFFCKNNYELNKIIKHLEEKKLILIDEIYGGVSNKVVYEDDNEPNINEFLYNFYDIKIRGSNGKHILQVDEYPYVVLSLTTEGLKYQEEKKRNRINSKQCFVAMWFDKKMEKIYKAYIKPAIEETDAKFEPIKINDVHHNNDINDQIIAEIRRSRFMVVDLTGDRGGVYFEAGFGFGLDIPVIYTCNKDWLEKTPEHEGVHFDVNHRNILIWTNENLAEFKKNLTARINAVIT